MFFFLGSLSFITSPKFTQQVREISETNRVIGELLKLFMSNIFSGNERSGTDTTTALFALNKACVRLSQFLRDYGSILCSLIVDQSFCSDRWNVICQLKKIYRKNSLLMFTDSFIYVYWILIEYSFVMHRILLHITRCTCAAFKQKEAYGI